MKKTMKRYLSLLLAAIMLVTTFSFAASAANVCTSHQTAVGNPDYCKVVNPTCATEGYTIYYCINCGQEVSRGDPKSALGHKFNAGEFVPVDGGNSYRKQYTCLREYTQDGKVVSCPVKEYETDGGKEVVYYLVEFINNKVTAGYNEDIDYAEVADTFTEKTLFTTYVRAGEEAIYAESTPFREKTLEFARYLFIGWTEDADLADATMEDNLGDEDCRADLVITKNTKLYPVFEGLTKDENGPIMHRVQFFEFSANNAVSPVTNPQYVLHGDSPKFSDPAGVLYNPPAKEEDVVNTYKFEGWSAKAYMPYSKTLIKNEDIESTPVYGDVNFYPVYSAQPKEYTVEFYDDVLFAGKRNLLKYTVDGKKYDAVFDGINLETNLLAKEGIALLNNDATALAKPADDDYIYVWTGKWAILNENGTIGRTVSLTSLGIYDNEFTVNDEGKKVIKLVPVYERKRQLYAVDIEMLVPSSEDRDYYRGGADVHVVANNGQLVASGTTDADGIFRCYLYNQTPFTVTVATSDDKYLGTGTISILEKAYDGNQDIEAQLNRCAVQMELNPEYETHCRCLHHNPFFQPIWVRMLNILYNIFNFKYVCCYDMYSTIGPLLEYTP
ncbi:MAG: hypothetical protein IJN68_04785 [Clostridia bacterium]|nr:hypothetical protein [Clostridia bacterium]